jgi:hypothetical protein
MPACFVKPLFPPRIELGILRVLDARDDHALRYGNPNAERSSAMANSFPNVDVLRWRKLLDRSCKIAVSFHLFPK